MVIDEFSFKAFRLFLEYLYTGGLPEILPFELCTELLHLSDQYLVPHLKRLTELRTQRYVSKETVLELYQLSKDLKAPELHQFCLKFILKHYKDLHQLEEMQTIKSDFEKYFKL